MIDHTFEGLITDVQARIDELSRRPRPRTFSGTVLVDDFGAVGDGAEDDSPAIQRAIDYAQERGRSLECTPGKTYRLGATLRNNRKALRVMALGANFLIDHTNDAFQIFGRFETSTPVSSLTTSRENTAVSGTLRTMYTAATPSPVAGWIPGDMIRLVADNIIPGTKYEFTGDPLQSRVGDFLNVVSTSSGSVKLTGLLEDPFTTNIRMARMDKTITFEWVGGSFEYTDAAFAAAGGPNIFFVAGMFEPVIRSVSMKRFRFSAIHVRDCYGWIVKDSDFGYGINDLTTGANGYGVANSSSSYGVVSACKFRNCRHGYSDGSGFFAAGDTRIEGFGRPVANVIVDCFADSCTGSGFDTHTQALNTTFVNCYTRNCFYGFGLRGRSNYIRQCTVIGAERAVWSFQEVTGESWGHVIDGLTAVDCDSILVVDANNQPESPTLNNRETRAVIAKNITARGLKGRVISVTNASVEASNWHVTTAAVTTETGALLGNSSLYMHDLFVRAGSPTAAIGAMLVLANGGAGSASVNYVKLVDCQIVNNGPGVVTNVVRGSNANSYIRIVNLSMSTPPSGALTDRVYPALVETTYNYN